MANSRVFTSFDFDHDQNLRNLLVSQAKNPDSPIRDCHLCAASGQRKRRA